MADGAKIFNIGIPNISGTGKTIYFKLMHASTMRSNFDGMQKLGQDMTQFMRPTF